MLDVFLYDVPVGQIREDQAGRLAFQYSEQALDEPARFQISVRMPVRVEAYGHEATTVFFENLLPEGEGRDLIAQARHFAPADVAGLLGMVGGECAGAVSLWPAGMAPSEQPTYRSLADVEMAALFDREYGARVIGMQVSERLSMSGAQQKMVFLRQGGSLALPLNGSPSNVIVKRAGSAYPGLVLNELVCMRLAAGSGMDAARSNAIGGERLLFESVRYDRVESASGTLRRLHQEDLCQATGHRPAQKYQARGGPAYADLARLIRRHTADPLRELDTLVRWALFNVLIGNNDAHAKNLSLLYAPEGLRLAPVYDLVSTEVYAHIDRRFSIEIGGQRTPAALHREALDKFARSLGMAPGAIPRLGLPLIERVRAELRAVLHDVASTHGHDPVLDPIESLVGDRTALVEAWLRTAVKTNG
jgi:serine/threonine-protein kinase HipA